MALETDRETAARIAHSLKGVSGNLGMTDLQHTTAILESACREGTGNIEILLNDVVNQLEIVINGIKPLDQRVSGVEAIN